MLQENEERRDFVSFAMLGMDDGLMARLTKDFEGNFWLEGGDLDS